MTSPFEIIAQWQRRLVALAEPAAVERQDGQSDPVASQSRKMLAFTGYPEDLLSAAEDRLWAPLPKLFRAFMATMGRNPGALFAGFERAGPADFGQFRCNALELLAETDLTLELPYRAVVFLFKERKRFYLVIADGKEDGPVYCWAVGDSKVKKVAESFKAFVDAELEKMEQ